MPEIVEWESQLGSKYIIERSVDAIAKQLLTPEREETKDAQDEAPEEAGD